MVTFVINYLVKWVRVSANIDAMHFGLVYAIAMVVFVVLCYSECHSHFTPILTIADCL